MSEQLETTKEALLRAMADVENIEQVLKLAKAYSVICHAEQSERVTAAQITGGCFSPIPPNPFEHFDAD